MTTKIRTTEQVIQDMLTENTGRALCDSGGAYGRNWEKNQGRDFSESKHGVIEWCSDGPIVSLSLYHWLVERLGEYRDDLTDKLHTFGQSEEMECESWPETLRAWLEKRGINESGVIGENSYNGEDVLSQVIQWWEWDEEDENGFEFRVVALQIHGGCDVRGGYTEPRIFEIDDQYTLCCNADATIWCNECGVRWYTDDAWNWYNDNDVQSLRETAYEKADGFPIVDEDNLTDEEQTMINKLISARKQCEQLENTIPICDVGPMPPLGFILVVDSVGMCPVCGKGQLQAG